MLTLQMQLFEILEFMIPEYHEHKMRDNPLFDYCKNAAEGVWVGVGGEETELEYGGYLRSRCRTCQRQQRKIQEHATHHFHHEFRKSHRYICNPLPYPASGVVAF